MIFSHPGPRSHPSWTNFKHAPSLVPGWLRHEHDMCCLYYLNMQFALHKSGWAVSSWVEGVMTRSVATAILVAGHFLYSTSLMCHKKELSHGRSSSRKPVGASVVDVHWWCNRENNAGLAAVKPLVDAAKHRLCEQLKQIHAIGIGLQPDTQPPPTNVFTARLRPT